MNQGRIEPEMIVFFDGICHLCQGTVKFVLPRDRSGKMHFSSLQSEFAKKTLAALGVFPAETPESLVVLTYVDGRPRVEFASNSALRIATHLQFPWNLLGILRIVPVFIRDAAYSFVARNRYRWFGKDEVCFLPKPEWKNRFID